MRRNLSRILQCGFILWVALFPASQTLPVTASDLSQPDPLPAVVIQAIQHDLSPALAEISPLENSLPVLKGGATRLSPDFPVLIENYPLPKALHDGGGLSTAGAARQVQAIPDTLTIPAAMPPPLQSFDGVSNLFGGMPPDTQGDIGPNHYVQWINLHFAIYQIDKVNHTATLVYGPVPGNTLWQGFGGPCQSTNDGDPITLYDPLADRWLMTQFALPNYPNGPFYECVAVSQTANPTGAWHRYAFQMPVNKMNDYPKFGVWPDAYYMTVNQFNPNGSWGGAGVAALDRSALLAGAPANMVYFDLYAVNQNFGGILPADLDGLTLPPANAPGYFLEWDDAAWIPGVDALRLWEFRVNWSNPTASTFGLSGQPNQVIPTLDVDPNLCNYNRACIPQPGTPMKVDAISDRLMYRLQYRNFGSHETLVTNHTVDFDGTDRAGIHWLVLQKGAGIWAMQDEGVFSPDSNHRWMGSAALDHMGNLALGYSVASNSIFPSVRYAGRLSSDPPGTLPQGEQSLVIGTGSQTGESRWGDYSMMAVDPQDDCTFWYTQEYVAISGSATWKTRIGSFRFPNCSLGPQGALQGAVTDSSTSQGIPYAAVQAESSANWTLSTLTDENGMYTLQAPVGVYTVTASAYNYLPGMAYGVTIAEDQTTLQDFALDPAPTYTVSGVVSDRRVGWPLYARLAISGSPVDPLWTDPLTGAYQVQLPAGQVFNFITQAFAPGYQVKADPVGPLTANLVLDIELEVEPSTCTAPGYQIDSGVCSPQPGGLVVGLVQDANTLLGLAEATVSNDLGRSTQAQATPTDPSLPDGFYTIFSPAGLHNHTASMFGGYQPLAVDVSVVLSDTVRQDFTLPAGSLEVAPEALNVALKIGQVLTVPLTLTNQGGLAASFEFVELDWAGPAALPWGPLEPPEFALKPFRQNLPSTEGVKLPDSPPATPLASGAVLASWPASQSLDPWSVAFDPVNNSIWVNSPAASWYGEDRMEEYSLLGDFTGRGFLHTQPHSTGPADLATHWGSGKLWIMNVNSGVANCIYEIDPDSGYTGNSICPGGGAGFTNSQRGLAYDPVTDTWFAGGWNDLSVYRFDSQGTILTSRYLGLRISGLAYNPQTQHLFAMVNASITRVYILDVADNFATLGFFSISQGFGAYAGAGIELDCEGNLWAIDQNTSIVYKVDSGESANLCNLDVPWLRETPVSGQALANGGQALIGVRFDASVPEVPAPGVYYAQLKIREDTPYLLANVPITMTVLPLDFGVALSPDQALSGIPGETITYTLQVTNTSEGPSDSFQLSLGAHNWVSNLEPVLIGPLAQGEAAQLKVAVRIPTDALPGEFEQLMISAVSAGDPSKTDTAQLTTSAEVGLADLVMSKSLIEGEYRTGDVLTYTLTVTNNGLTKAAGVTLVDVLPLSAEIVAVPEWCTTSGRLVACELGILAVGEVRSVVIAIRARDVGLFVNQAWVVAYTEDPQPINNWATVSTQVTGLVYYLPQVFH